MKPFESAILGTRHGGTSTIFQVKNAYQNMKSRLPTSFNIVSLLSRCRTPLFFGLIIYFIFTISHYLSTTSSLFTNTAQFSQLTVSEPPTNLNHLVFGLMGSERAWQFRKNYIESWWRPNITKGYIFLDKAPNPGLLPWPETSPPYRVSADLHPVVNKSDIRAQRMVNGIMEVMREVENEHSNVRWLIMGDDDSIFFVDNIVDVLSKIDHKKYHYLGGISECVWSNFLFNWQNAFGGAGIMLSYPLAKAMARDMNNCLKRYAYMNSSDNTTRSCVADIGTNLTPLKGIHQIDMHGDISGLLQTHPLAPLMSLHHFDFVDPIFPSMERFDATRHLMIAAAADQSRMLQQTICFHRQNRWSFSISWGYSVQIYDTILPRSHLQMPVETFLPWSGTPGLPHFVFNTRPRSTEPCLSPHNFFLETVRKAPEGHEVQTTYARAAPRGLPECTTNGGRSADFLHVIQVLSPATKRTETDRCECCDILRVEGDKVQVKLRRCLTGEVIVGGDTTSSSSWDSALDPLALILYI